jgi:hypothetical protein
LGGKPRTTLLNKRRPIRGSNVDICCRHRAASPATRRATGRVFDSPQASGGRAVWGVRRPGDALPAGLLASSELMRFGRLDLPAAESQNRGHTRRAAAGERGLIVLAHRDWRQVFATAAALPALTDASPVAAGKADRARSTIVVLKRGSWPSLGTDACFCDAIARAVRGAEVAQNRDGSSARSRVSSTRLTRRDCRAGRRSPAGRCGNRLPATLPSPRGGSAAIFPVPPPALEILGA